jgi:hypothetical protein
MYTPVSSELKEGLSGFLEVTKGKLAGQLKEYVRGSVEEALNQLLDAEADRQCGGGRYERTAERITTRAGKYERQLITSACLRELGRYLKRQNPIRHSTEDAEVAQALHYSLREQRGHFMTLQV